MAGLTPKQQLFCEEYLIDLNATQAAIRAGYSEKTAQVIGAENLAKPMVQEYLAERMKARQERTEIDQDYVLNVIKETVERCRQVRPVTDRAGNQIMVETEDGEVAPAFGFDAKNVLKGAELMGRHLGLWKDKVDHSHAFIGPDGKPLSFTVKTVYVSPGDPEAKG